MIFKPNLFPFAIAYYWLNCRHDHLVQYIYDLFIIRRVNWYNANKNVCYIKVNSDLIIKWSLTNNSTIEITFLKHKTSTATLIKINIRWKHQLIYIYICLLCTCISSTTARNWLNSTQRAFIVEIHTLLTEIPIFNLLA